jgi:hypothetical protein
MSHPPTTGNGPWRILILDPDPADPKWILTVVAEPGDVRPAKLGDTDPDELTRAWVASGRGPVALTPVRHARSWRVDENPPLGS